MALFEFAPAYPEIFLTLMVSAILILDLFLSDSRRAISYWLTLITLLGCAAITVTTFGYSALPAFNGMFMDDPMSDVLKLITYIVVISVLVYSRQYTELRGLFRGEFLTLVLLSTLGMMVMISANHFLTLYLGLELMSLSLYAVVALDRDSPIATEAAMKYFVLGALSSGLLLYGMSMIYGATGSLALSDVAYAILGAEVNRTVLTFGLVFVVAGSAFKLGAAPFHMWVPDVYHGAPTPVTLFIATATKLAAFAFTLRLLVEGLQQLASDWQGMLILLSIISIAIGNITAIAQTNLKRMLAYSSIAHMGYMLLGILSGTLNGYASAMYYVVIYVLMSLGTFGMIILLSRKGFEADNLDDFRGLNQRSPWYAFIMLLLMFSMAGVPPTVGFYAKLAVFQAVLEAGFIWLAVAAVLLSVVGAYYYLRVIKLMYFDEPLERTPLTPRRDMRIIMGANGLAILGLGILPQPLMALCLISIQNSL
ncbi:MAG TPA: NADH-quinone oxidoreductase subunit NuoN [Burkholderiales bacterium]|nr:NADH-quinone oxidoreductase subunit NuoN [Burkholderiales bacterium]